MYKLKDKYKGQGLKASTAAAFNGKKRFHLELANQAELEFCFNNGNDEFIEKVRKTRTTKSKFD